MILQDINQHTDTSGLAFTVANNNGLLTGTVTATKFGWQGAQITSGAYVASTKSFAITANVGGDDGDLMLGGTLNGTTLSGDASTNGLRAGTWSAEK